MEVRGQNQSMHPSEPIGHEAERDPEMLRTGSKRENSQPHIWNLTPVVHS